jgi:hypothetical protein
MSTSREPFEIGHIVCTRRRQRARDPRGHLGTLGRLPRFRQVRPGVSQTSCLAAVPLRGDDRNQTGVTALQALPGRGSWFCQAELVALSWAAFCPIGGSSGHGLGTSRPAPRAGRTRSGLTPTVAAQSKWMTRKTRSAPHQAADLASRDCSARELGFCARTAPSAPSPYDGFSGGEAGQALGRDTIVDGWRAHRRTPAKVMPRV